MNLIGKKIISTTVEDTRFLCGENIMDSFWGADQFGKKMVIYFEDQTYMSVEIVEVGDHGEHLLASHHGRWKLQFDSSQVDPENNAIIIVD